MGREYFHIGSQQGDESPPRDYHRTQEDLVTRQCELLSQVINMTNNPRATIRVEPKISWPKLGDDNTGGKDVIDFYERLEEIFGLANNGQGMSATERLVALKNCLSGSRKIIYENVWKASPKNGERQPEDPEAVYRDIKKRLMKYLH